MKWLVVLCMAAVLSAGCVGAVDTTNTIVQQNHNHGIFGLSIEAACVPVCIGGAAGGAMWLETEQGKIILTDKAAVLAETPTQKTWQWHLEQNRQATLHVETNNHEIRLTLAATPDNDILGWGLAIEAQPEEYFTGLIEKTVDGDQAKSWQEGITTAMNLRGEEVNMSISPTVALYCPFLLSSRGYSIFTEGTWPGHYDICKSDPGLVKIRFDGPQLKLVIDTAKTPAQLVQKQSLRVGPTILPPRWAFRPWRWRDEHNHRETYYDGTPVKAPYNSELVEDILMMEAFGIPCGAYWVDRPWGPGHRGYDDFLWDEKRLPKTKEMIAWLDQRNIRFLLWLAPWVNGDMAKEAKEKGYEWIGPETHKGDGPLVDFTHPEGRRWWQQYIAKIIDDGVAGFKLDRAEEYTPGNRDQRSRDGRTNREMRNAYPVEYAKAVCEICREKRGDDFVVMPRAGYANSSRYAAFWGGDIGSPAEGLRCAIIAVQRSAIMGFPIWGSDTGGYWQGALDREVCARWLAFSCFTPIMEVGPTENRGLWDMKKEPHYDAELIAIWRLYARLHDQLADYSYELAKVAKKTGMPPVRPLFLHWPDQPQAWQDWQTFMYGPDILVSALWQKGQLNHTLYLPAGEEWIDAWTGKTYTGGQHITLETPLYKIPLFIRQGSSVQLGDLNRLWRESLEIARVKPDLNTLQQKAFHQN